MSFATSDDALFGPSAVSAFARDDCRDADDGGDASENLWRLLHCSTVVISLQTDEATLVVASPEHWSPAEGRVDQSRSRRS
jgi:hypothetical protein